MSRIFWIIALAMIVGALIYPDFFNIAWMILWGIFFAIFILYEVFSKPKPRKKEDSF